MTLTLPLVPPRTRRSKYGNRKTVVDGITFDSQREARHYQELRLREKAGEISELALQPTFDLEVRGILIARYRGDFYFVEHQRDAHGTWPVQVVADSKGMKTAVYRLKKKLMKAIHGIEIREL